MNENICFQIHHLPGLRQDRDQNVIKNKIKLNKIYDLNLKTIEIKNNLDYFDFIKNQDNFKADIEYFKDSPGDIGLIASYYLAAKKFIDSEYEYFLSIEDEAVIFDNFLDLLPNYIKKLPEDADILFLSDEDSPAIVSYNQVYKKYFINDTIWIANHWHAGLTILFTKNGAKNFVKYIEQNIVKNYIDVILIDVSSPSSIISSKDGKLIVTLTGEIPKLNKRFNAYRLSKSVQPIAGYITSESIIRKNLK